MKPYFVFISHAGEDVFIARMLARLIEEVGAKAFVFSRDGAAGAAIDVEIRSAAKQADELLVVLTPESMNKNYVVLELGMFFYMERPISGLLHRIDARTFQRKSDLPAEIKGRNLLALNEAEAYIDSLRARMSERKEGGG